MAFSVLVFFATYNRFASTFAEILRRPKKNDRNVEDAKEEVVPHYELRRVKITRGDSYGASNCVMLMSFTEALKLLQLTVEFVVLS